MAAGQRAVVILDANTAAFNTKMKAAGATFVAATHKMNRALTSLVMKAGIFGTVFGLAAGIVTKEAAKIEKGITEIGTLVGGLTDNEMQAMREQLQDLAAASGQSMETLIDARYDVVSAGFINVAESAKVMQAATKGAVATNSEVAESADLLTTALNAYGKAAGKSMQVMDVFNVTIDKGKTRMNELANVMGRAIPLAAQLDIPLEQLSAAVAVLTKNGQNAREAVTGLRSVFVKMLKPTTKTNEVLKEIGASSLDALIQSRGLQGSLEALKKGAESLGYNLADVINRARGMTAAFPLAGGSASEFNEILSAINDSAGATNKDFKDMQQTLMNLMKRGWQKLKTIMADIGYEVMPAVRKHFEDFLNYLDKNGTQIVKDWGKGLEKHLNIIINLVKQLNKLMPILIGYFSASILVSVGNNLRQIGNGILMIFNTVKKLIGALATLGTGLGIGELLGGGVTAVSLGWAGLIAAAAALISKLGIMAYKHIKYNKAVKKSRKAAEGFTVSLKNMDEELKKQKELAQFEVDTEQWLNTVQFVRNNWEELAGIKKAYIKKLGNIGGSLGYGGMQEEGKKESRKVSQEMIKQFQDLRANINRAVPKEMQALRDDLQSKVDRMFEDFYSGMREGVGNFPEQIDMIGVFLESANIAPENIDMFINDYAKKFRQAGRTWIGALKDGFEAYKEDMQKTFVELEDAVPDDLMPDKTFIMTLTPNDYLKYQKKITKTLTNEVDYRMRQIEKVRVAMENSVISGEQAAQWASKKKMEYAQQYSDKITKLLDGEQALRRQQAQKTFQIMQKLADKGLLEPKRVEKYIAKVKKQIEEMGDEGIDQLTKTEQRIQNFAQTMSSRFSSALTQMIDESKFSFQAIAQSFGRMLEQMAAELAAKAIIFESFKLLSMATGWDALGTALGSFSEFAFGDMGKTTAPVNTQTRTLNIDKNISSGDSITVNYNPTVQAIDGKDAKRYFMTEGRQALVDNIDHAVKNRQSKTLKANK